MKGSREKIKLGFCDVNLAEYASGIHEPQSYLLQVRVEVNSITASSFLCLRCCVLESPVEGLLEKLVFSLSNQVCLSVCLSLSLALALSLSRSLALSLSRSLSLSLSLSLSFSLSLSLSFSFFLSSTQVSVSWAILVTTGLGLFVLARDDVNGRRKEIMMSKKRMAEATKGDYQNDRFQPLSSHNAQGVEMKE